MSRPSGTPPSSLAKTETFDPGPRSGPAPASYVLVIAGTSSSRRAIPRDGVVLVGRDRDADLRIDDPSISRHHAKLIASGGEVTVADLGSHNGTRVNGEVVEGARPLVSGDVVTLCEVTLVFHRDRAPGEHASHDGPGSAPAIEHVFGDLRVTVSDPAMVRMFDLVRRLAPTDLPVLVLGETGAGKESAARALHEWSRRAARPLVPINCANLAPERAEDDLFGHERGAFTSAHAPKPGLLEEADGGTVFFDEVGELSEGVQAKLLRVIEQKRLRRVGAVHEREIDVRIVAATNRDLEAECRAKRFRQDLYFRLSAASVIVPPLRDRPREVPILARRFFAEARARFGQPPTTLSEAVMQALAAYRWEGNVRELKNAMEWAAATLSGDRVEVQDLPDKVRGGGARAERAEAETSTAPAAPEAEPPRAQEPLADELRRIERARIEEALRAAGGVQMRAANMLGMPIRTFINKLNHYGLHPKTAKKRG